MAGIPTVYERIADIILSLDNYTEVIFLAEQDGMGRKDQQGVVRDLPRYPGEARRVTLRDRGSEFFVDAATLERAGYVGLTVKNQKDGQQVTLIAA